ncbi:ATP-binding cassette domain-containing protein [Bacteroidota bacterium]
MTIFSCYNISKAFAGGALFEEVAFGMESGERVGLIGKNGIGKTTLLSIIAQKDLPDDGEVVFNNNASIEYLEQNPRFDSQDIILDAVMLAKSILYETLNEHQRLCAILNDKFNDATSKKVDELTQFIENEKGWNLKNEAKAFLTKLGITNFYDKINTLSGGLQKRVALARALLSDPDLLILDEPTNHLDADSVQWLQDRLMASKKSLLFVTHDRYFLDALSTKIIELNDKRLFVYSGNYEKHLERKATIEDIKDATIGHTRSKLRVELAWLQRGARARRSKQKSKIDWIDELKNESKKSTEKKIKIELGKTFIGKRIIEAYNIGKSIGGKRLFDDFTYLAKPGDKIGVIGPNGSGKSTMLNVLSGRIKNDEGLIKVGPTIKIGYFKQESTELKENQTVIGSLKEIAEYIDVGEGRDRYLTARDLLERFLFPHKQHNAFISTLSGGERRRLQILRVLMANPNVLFLDEPTNDLDIPTLHALEDYLENFYGVLLVVSHDRAFLDRIVNEIYAFDGKGNIKEYPGNYSYYLEQKEKNKLELAGRQISQKHIQYMEEKQKKQQQKLSYKAQLEYNRLEKEIPELEEKKTQLEELLNSGEITDYTELEIKSKELVELESKIEDALLRWMELGEKV